MFNTIYILQFDNYYDRRIHPYYSTLDDGGYGLYLEWDTAGIPGVNFNPSDGVDTELVVNIHESQKGNYLVVVNEDNKVDSRWFIIDEVRIRAGQYKLTLHRDVITDYWNIIKQSPALIEKCNIDYDNPLIFNNEDMSFNQIKKYEVPLMDDTYCPWLVAYIAKDVSKGLEGTVNIRPKVDGEDIGVIPINDTIENWQSKYSGFMGDYKTIKYKIYCEGPLRVFDVNGISGGADYKSSQAGKDSTLRTTTAFAANATYEKALENGFKTVGLDYINSFLPSETPERHTEDELIEFLYYNGKTIVDTNGKVFKVNIPGSYTSTVEHSIQSGSLFSALSEAVKESRAKNLFGETKKAFNGQPNNKTFSVVISYDVYDLQLFELYSYEVSYNLSGSRTPTEDAVYDIITVPYGSVNIIINGIEDPIITDKDINLATIQAIAKGMDASCYDIQLVPYCPVPNSAYGDTIELTNPTQYSLITTDNANVGVVINVPNANFSTDVFYPLPKATSSIERKINNECDKWRLCSPNYSNYFEFNVEKNDGVVYFNVDCTYKPYNPYIHINPNFGYLYGQDFNDPRGLICGGDFSLSQVRDAWESYQLQNKNFQATFDRQIQNMEFNNKYQRINDIVGAATGTMTGAGAGAASGAFMSPGNPYAMVAGGVVGGAASGIAGGFDVEINQKLRNEALDFTHDLFGYQLGNIKALPLTLTKVSAFNANNKIFPVLEYYTCTDTEKIAFANKLAYNGMTYMVIDTFENCIKPGWEYTINDTTIKSQNYIKGKPIYLHNFGDDYHVANTIARELNMGFYIVEEE